MGRFFHRYLLFSGLLINLGLVAVLSFGVYKLVSMGVSPTVIANKIANKIESRSPWLADLIRLDSQTEALDFYLDEISLDDWRGKGAGTVALSGLNSHQSLSSQNDNPVSAVTTSAISNRVEVGTVSEFFKALKSAQPGSVIVLSPGIYEISKRTIPIIKPGTELNPITVQADRLGDVVLKLKTLEGFYVAAPHWVFQNLKIEGACARDSKCEHAFHIVGGGDYVVLRNNIITDFNSHIKVNGTKKGGVKRFPDNGLIEANNFFNHGVRKTSSPVTLLDIIAVDDWVVRDNLIADFVKGGSNKISYAAFFKGNGSGNVFERNLVVCSLNQNIKGGIRVGLSFGGGGTGGSACRNNQCGLEHTNGTLRHNVIMNCNDVGIYLNKSKNTEIYNNTLINTTGIDIRFPESSAVIANNVLSGRIKERQGGSSYQISNLVVSLDEMKEIFRDPLRADFFLKDVKRVVDLGADLQAEEQDFCGTPRATSGVDLGAFEYQANNNEPACSPFNMQ